MANSTTSVIWYAVMEELEFIKQNIQKIPIEDYYKESVLFLIKHYRNCVVDWRFYALCLLFILYYYVGKSHGKSCNRKKTLIELETQQRHRNMDNETQSNIFDLAKTGYEVGHTEIVQGLVETTGYDVNFVTPDTGLSLFMCGCISGKKELIKYLLLKGGDIISETEDGDSPLYLATFGVLNSGIPDPAVIKLLLIAGCDVNQQNKKGFTSLHRAASKGNIDVIKCLLNYGADPNICNNAGIYPLDSAINAGHLDVAELLHIDVENPYVWDVVEPHTPTHIVLGLQSPQRKLLQESSRPQHSSSNKVFT